MRLQCGDSRRACLLDDAGVTHGFSGMKVAVIVSLVVPVTTKHQDQEPTVARVRIQNVLWLNMFGAKATPSTSIFLACLTVD